MSNGAPVQRPIGFSPWEISARINRSVVQQHAEEAAFLWTQRDRAALAPNYSLKDLARLDGRVEAHLDGLRVAGNIGWEICSEARKLGAGEAFASAILAFESADTRRIDMVLETGCSDPALERGLVSALGWILPAQARQICERLASSESAEVRRVGIAGLAVHRLDAGLPLSVASLDENSRLRSRALEAIGELGRSDLFGALVSHLSDHDAHSRFCAAWSAARIGIDSEPATDALRQIAEAATPDSERAVDTAVRSMSRVGAEAWRQQLGLSPETLRLAVIAAGAIGDPQVIEELIRLMENCVLARIAGDAFSMITGADLNREHLDADASGGDGEADGADPDEGLPWPSPERIARWWFARSEGFQPGVRYLRGQPITTESLAGALVQGTQRQRYAAALELSIRNAGQVLFEVRERGDRQLDRMKQWIS